MCVTVGVQVRYKSDAQRSHKPLVRLTPAVTTQYSQQPQPTQAQASGCGGGGHALGGGGSGSCGGSEEVLGVGREGGGARGSMRELAALGATYKAMQVLTCFTGTKVLA
jgi:hypothetical protein